MAAIKHVGRLVRNQRRVIVAYRVVPNEADSAIIVTTENLMADEHDALIKLVESDAGQQAYELAEAMARTRLPDGRNMLAAFHTTGKMVKVNQSEVEMIPDTQSSVNLAELNKIIAKNKGVTVGDLAIKPNNGEDIPRKVEPAVASPAESVYLDEAQVTNEQPLTDEELASQYRSQADRMSKEAAALRRQAEELVPTKKKSQKKVVDVGG